MFRFVVFLPFTLLAGAGCRQFDYADNSSLEDASLKSGIKMRIWSQVAGPQEMADAEREVVFNHHLDAALEEMGNADSEYGLVFANAKMQAKLKAISSARPQPETMVNAPVENQLDIELDCHIYRQGAAAEEAIVPVPAGGSRNLKLQAGGRYCLVWTKAGTGEVVGEQFCYRKPAYEGMPATVRYRRM